MSHSIHIERHAEAAVTTVTFSDQERLNRLCWAAVDELACGLRTARESGSRVVVLTSSLPGSWLQHAWLQDLLWGLDGEPQTGDGLGWFRVLSELAHEDVVSIAAINGDASGGGAEIGWACDLRVAERQARFSQLEVDLGLTTGIGGCSRLLRLAGRGVTTQMVLTGKPVEAERLYQMGAINYLVEQGTAVVAAQELAMTLSKKSVHALRGLKQVLAFAGDNDLDSSLRFEQEVFQAVSATPEAREAMSSEQAAQTLASDRNS